MVIDRQIVFTTLAASPAWRPLFRSQRHHRIDQRRFHRRQRACDERDQREHQRRDRERRRIVRVDAVQQSGDQSRRGVGADQSGDDARRSRSTCPATTIIRTTRARSAPSARRMPISCVRSATAYATTP